MQKVEYIQEYHFVRQKVVEEGSMINTLVGKYSVSCSSFLFISGYFGIVQNMLYKFK
jgi:hypothetical protein